jgi:hypothetical protein
LFLCLDSKIFNIDVYRKEPRILVTSTQFALHDTNKMLYDIGAYIFNKKYACSECEKRKARDAKLLKSLKELEKMLYGYRALSIDAPDEIEKQKFKDILVYLREALLLVEEEAKT